MIWVVRQVRWIEKEASRRICGWRRKIVTTAMATLEGAVGSSDKVMVGDVWYVKVSIVKGPVFGFWSVKEG